MTLHIHPHDDAWLTLFIITRGESSDRWDLFYKNAQTQEINGRDASLANGNKGDGWTEVRLIQCTCYSLLLSFDP